MFAFYIVFVNTISSFFVAINFSLADLPPPHPDPKPGNSYQVLTSPVHTLYTPPVAEVHQGRSVRKKLALGCVDLLFNVLVALRNGYGEDGHALIGGGAEVPRASGTDMNWKTQIWTFLEDACVLPSTSPPARSPWACGGLAWLSLPAECGMPFLLLSSGAGLLRNSRRLQEPSSKTLI